jgi:hypothetical protein
MGKSPFFADFITASVVFSNRLLLNKRIVERGYEERKEKPRTSQH